jgi:hypothetical protein
MSASPSEHAGRLEDIHHKGLHAQNATDGTDIPSEECTAETCYHILKSMLFERNAGGRFNGV